MALQKIKGNERAERCLALLIMRHVNRGENDPERLAVSAALDFLRKAEWDGHSGKHHQLSADVIFRNDRFEG